MQTQGGEEVVNTPITLERILELCEQDENIGICRQCGAEQSNVEPDASNTRCEECGAHLMTGAETLLIAWSDQ